MLLDSRPSSSSSSSSSSCFPESFPPEKERETICPIVSRACLTRIFLTISTRRLSSRTEEEASSPGQQVFSSLPLFGLSRKLIYIKEKRAPRSAQSFSVSFNQFAISPSATSEFPVSSRRTRRNAGTTDYEWNEVSLLSVL